MKRAVFDACLTVGTIEIDVKVTVHYTDLGFNVVRLEDVMLGDTDILPELSPEFKVELFDQISQYQRFDLIEEDSKLSEMEMQ